MKHFLILIPLLFCTVTPVQSQALAEEVLPPSYIRTIVFGGDEFISGTPVIGLGENIHLEFDDIIGDEANYYYTIEHFNYDWSPSQLVKTEYLEGFDNVRIDNYKNSYNTLQLYSHYSLRIPNEDTQGLKVSGNYLLSVFNENRELVFSRKFMLFEPLTQVEVEIRRPRDVKLIHSQQVVNFKVASPDFILKNPNETVTAVVLQNYNLKTGIYNIKPQYNLGNELIYRYDKLTSFWAGNEYLEFDSKDLRAANASIGRIEVRDLYHHFLYRDKVRAFEPYTYNPDINGSFLIRTLQGQEPDIEAEYVWTHFSLETFEPLEGGEIHLYGGFNNFVLDETTRLSYNSRTGMYETARLFKQGFYNYKYVFVRNDGILDEGFISGNFAKTENLYTVLIYYRPLGGRYDRIIGAGNANSINLSN